MLSPRTDAGRRGLTALLAGPRSALVALDYDGTLAPIVEDPASAVPVEGVVDVLVALAPLVGKLALITGRPADAVVELGGLGGVPGLVVLGQYGVQRWEDGVLTEEPADPGLDLARTALAALALTPGTQVEDKGLSLAVHTRRTDDPVVAMGLLHPVLSRVAADSGLQLHLGRLVLELRPPGFDKGGSVRRMAEGCATVLFIGDDLGDLAAFDAVDDLRRKGLTGLLVCSDSDETPTAMRDRADLLVTGATGVVALLQELTAELG
ncbi:MAG: trehalose-phosphatase [Frankiales bacterium]|nr:trehalose-phosphatase [Frankiales bacterium]